MIIDAADLEAALTSKGFRLERNTNDKMFYFYYQGRRTKIHTKISFGRGEDLRDKLAGKVKKQTRRGCLGHRERARGRRSRSRGRFRGIGPLTQRGSEPDMETLKPGDRFEFPYPFARATYSQMDGDEDGPTFTDVPTWKVGVRHEDVSGQGDVTSFADGLHKPGKYPEADLVDIQQCYVARRRADRHV